MKVVVLPHVDKHALLVRELLVLFHPIIQFEALFHRVEPLGLGVDREWKVDVLLIRMEGVLGGAKDRSGVKQRLMLPVLRGTSEVFNVGLLLPRGPHEGDLIEIFMWVLLPPGSLL